MRNIEAELLEARMHAQLTGNERAACVRLGRFDVLSCIGRGGMGMVFEARDRACGAPLALKVLHAGLEDRIERLRREFRSLAAVSHPTLVTLYELHVEQGLPFLTMELIKGRRIDLCVAELKGERSRSAFARAVLGQLLQGLHELHGQGWVHGDVKPSNILLKPGGELVLVDFGLARVLTDHEMSSGSGTPGYMAPERLARRRLTPASDWYAVGALLHEILTGGRHTQDASGAAREQPSDDSDGELESLQRLCRGLLHPNPESRFGAAEVSDHLRLEASQQMSLVSSADELFVGRDAELEVLRHALIVAKDRPVIVTVEGAPGIGKTALVAHFMAQLRRTGSVVLGGRCYAEDYLPYNGMDGVAAALVEYIRRLSDAARRDLQPDGADALVQILPVLRRAFPEAGTEPSAGDPRLIRSHAFDALTDLLGRIAQRGPVVIHLDDLQWGDTDSAILLEHLLQGPHRPRLLLVASFRSGEAGECIDVLRSAETSTCHFGIHLRELEASNVSELVCLLRGGQADDWALSWFMRHAGGSPLLLRALLSAEHSPQRAALIPPSYEGLVDRVLCELGPASRVLAQLAALAGRPMGAHLLGRASGSGAELPRLLAGMCRRGLLRRVEDQGAAAWLPYHDRVREAVVDSLAAEARRAGHLALADAALTLMPDNAEFLAEHLYYGGRLTEAAVFAERAADGALQVASLRLARELYARALECTRPERPERLVRKLADATALSGDVGRGAALCLEAASYGPDDALALRLRAAQMQLLSGTHDQDLPELRRALRQAGVPIPRTTLGAALCVARSVVRYLLLRRWGRRAANPPPDSRAELAFALGHAMLNSGGLTALALICWSSARAVGHGSAAQLGRAMAFMAGACAAVGIGSDATHDAWVDEAMALTQTDPAGRAYVLYATGAIEFGRGHASRSVAAFEAACRWIVARPSTARWLLDLARVLIVSVSTHAGRFRELQGTVAFAERDARESGNHASLAQLEHARAWAALAAGDPGPIEAFHRRATNEWGNAGLAIMAMWAEVHRLLYIGTPRAALAVLHTTRRALGRTGTRGRPWSVEWKRMSASVELACSSRPDDAHCRRAERLARALEREVPAWASDCAALVRGSLAQQRGERAAALEHFKTAATGLDAVGMLSLAGAAAYRAAELEGAPRPQDAYAWFAREQIREPDKWVRMYVP